MLSAPEGSSPRVFIVFVVNDDKSRPHNTDTPGSNTTRALCFQYFCRSPMFPHAERERERERNRHGGRKVRSLSGESRRKIQNSTSVSNTTRAAAIFYHLRLRFFPRRKERGVATVERERLQRVFEGLDLPGSIAAVTAPKIPKIRSLVRYQNSKLADIRSFPRQKGPIQKSTANRCFSVCSSKTES